MSMHSDPEVILCLKPYNIEDTIKVEIWYGELEVALKEADLLNIDELTVYGIPTHKEGLSDDITRFIFNLVEIKEKEAENAELQNKIF